MLYADDAPKCFYTWDSNLESAFGFEVARLLRPPVTRTLVGPLSLIFGCSTPLQVSYASDPYLSILELALDLKSPDFFDRQHAEPLSPCLTYPGLLHLTAPHILSLVDD